MNTQARTSVIVVFLVGFLALVGAYVALVMTGHQAQVQGMFAGAVALLTAAGVIGHQAVNASAQDKTLTQIQRQTNGVLDAKIREGAMQAAKTVLEQAGVPVRPTVAVAVDSPMPAASPVTPATASAPPTAGTAAVLAAAQTASNDGQTTDGHGA